MHAGADTAYPLCKRQILHVRSLCKQILYSSMHIAKFNIHVDYFIVLHEELESFRLEELRLVRPDADDSGQVSITLHFFNQPQNRPSMKLQVQVS